MVDLGNLSLGLAFSGFDVLDRVAQQLAAMDRVTHTAKLGVDTSAVSQAEDHVASLGTAHQALNKTATLGMDYSQLAQARTAIHGRIKAGTM